MKIKTVVLAVDVIGEFSMRRLKSKLYALP